jgi:hypothetical protein
MTFDLELMIDVASVQRCGTSETGRIWVRGGEWCFPEEGWSDFVVVVTAWLCDALCQIVSGGRDHVDVSFMDGPFLVQIHKLPGGMIRVVGVRRSRVPEVCGEATGDLRGFACSVQIAANDVVRWCLQYSWISTDIERLQVALTNLQRVLLLSRR